MRRDLPGTFLTRELGKGAWRLTRSEPTPIELIVLGAEPQAAEALRSPDVRDIGIEWRAAAVSLTMTSAGRSKSARTMSAIVHEPLPRLYDALPLASLDAKARRFWRRVFRLVRIPGGRHVLGVLARCARNRH
jgi:hypothetical protein